MFSTGLSSGEREGQQDDGEVLRDLQLVGLVPTSPVHEDDGVSPGGDIAADLIEVHFHGACVGPRQHKRRALATAGADRAEQIGVLVALVGRQARPRAGLGPKTGPAVLLAEPGFVLKPDFDRLALGQMAYVCCQRAGEVFLNPSSTWGSCFGCWGRPLM